MTKQDPIVITAIKRTPMGGFLGSLKGLNAPELGGEAIKAVVQDSKLANTDVDEVLMGCVLQAGLRQGPARQAARLAGLDLGTGCVTVNKLCGSAMKAAMHGYDSIAAETNNIVIAGGLESMSNAPYLLERARSGYRLGHGKIYDHMFYDGLEDAQNGSLMGVYAENTAEHYGFSRQDQDLFAETSLLRAQKATKEGLFKQEIVGVNVPSRKETIFVDQDEQPLKADAAKIKTLKPAFKDGGTVTAANSSSISDGAAACVMMRLSEAEKRGLKPLAKIVSHTTQSQEGKWFTTAPVGAINKLFEKTGWQKKDVDLFEINEAFAVVTMATMKEHNLPHDIVNIHGGACALGHPVGASGVRIMATLIHALHHYNLEKGVAAICIGGGEATAIALERL